MLQAVGALIKETKCMQMKTKDKLQDESECLGQVGRETRKSFLIGK